MRGDEGTETDATGDDNAQLARELSQSGGSKELQVRSHGAMRQVVI